VAAGREGLVDALHRSRAEELDELNARHRAARNLSVNLSILGSWLRRMTRAAAEPLPEVAAGEVGASFVGHASVVIRYPDLTVACDPMLGRHCSLAKRAVAPGLTSAELADVDLILIGNAQVDHLHVPTLRKLPRAATVVLPPRCAGLVSDLGFARLVELAVGQSLRHRGVDVTSTPVCFDTSTGRPACAYVLRGDGPAVYVCGESGYFSGFAEVGRRFRPDIAFLPIGGYLGPGFRARHMSPLDAIYAFEDLGARLMVPIRYGSFPLSYEKLAEPLAWFERLIADRELEDYVHVLAPGSSAKFTSASAAPAAPVSDAPSDSVDIPTD
jgi:L-ascorbate metabolism protein UlaG (beta-lactamase superfamily)